MANRGRGEQKDIESKDLLIVGKESNEARMTDTVIRVVDWIVNGKHYPQLEKREFFATEGGMKMGKAKGFNRQDLETVQDQWGEIMVALGGSAAEAQKRPAHPVSTSAAPAGASGPEQSYMGQEQEQDF